MTQRGWLDVQIQALTYGSYVEKTASKATSVVGYQVLEAEENEKTEA